MPSFKFLAYGRKQTDRHTHTHAQCSHASVGLAQAHPNNEINTKAATTIQLPYSFPVTCGTQMSSGVMLVVRALSFVHLISL